MERLDTERHAKEFMTIAPSPVTGHSAAVVT